MHQQNTIFALATPPVRSGVAVIRISGDRALPALAQLTGKADWQPNLARYTSFSRATNHEPRATIDSGLAFYFKAPKSFTGEDVAELHCHGSLAVIRELLEALAAIEGLRPAEPGEFTRRAFLNGKMDLVEAEGLADLIEAETPAQRKQALSQMQGEASRRYEALRGQIVQALAHLEAFIDFPEEEIPASLLDGIKRQIETLTAAIETALADDRRGERVRGGIRVVILGAPNVGKSSLLNRLAGRDAAIVSARAGTTRDVIEVHMELGGFPVILTDTAGLRESGDDIEEEGIRRAMARAEEADIKLVLFDASQGGQDEQSRGLIGDNTLIINNKADLLQSRITNHESRTTFFISTQTGHGLEEMLSALEQKISAMFHTANAPLITRSRHRALLTEALACLERLNWHAPLELTCEELRLAGRAIGKITGKIAVDDVLDVIFKQFCIGK
jgi:tRNA modification GTPase